MRASELIELLQRLIIENGDMYVTYDTPYSSYGMEQSSEVEVIPLYETKYFCIK